MTLPLKRISTLCILLTQFVLTGCSNSGAPKPPGGQTPAGNEAAAKSGALPEFTMNVIIQKGTDEDYETESVKTFPNPTAAQIEEQVRAHDWKSAQRRPNIGLAKTTKSGLNVLRVNGQLGSSDPVRALQAQWIGVEGGQEFLRRSPPLESLDAAIQLLLAFRNDDSSLKSKIEWKLEATE